MVVPGTILVADPFLKDPNFMRSVVFICEHQAEGSFGFVLNRKYDKVIGDLINDLDGCQLPVFYGGPVQLDTIHFIHQRPDLIGGGVEITDGIFWGGDFESVVQLIQTERIKPQHIRFFIGYSGWSEGQLAGELDEKSWLTTSGNKRLVFHPDENQIWPEALKQMGGDFQQLIHYPIDPQLN